jgi:hypothetical protein
VRVFRQDHGGVPGGDDKDVERRSHDGRVLIWRSRFEASGFPCEIERAEGVMDEERPPRRSDQPRDRDAAAVGAEAVTALAAAHAVLIATTVELRTAFAEAEERCGAREEGHRARCSIDFQALDGGVAVADRERERLGREVDRELAAAGGACCPATEFRDWLAPRGLDEGAIIGHSFGGAVLDSEYREPHGASANRRDLNFDFAPGLRRRGAESASGQRGPFQDLSAIPGDAHGGSISPRTR